METDAKGQLGGLECTDDMRRRMAQESGAWKCSSCGKSNTEILAECTEAARLADTSSKPDEEVPKELKMGWKDEMDKKRKDSDIQLGNGDDTESAELAEGFVQTAPLAREEAVVPNVVSYPAARPVQGVPQPTRTVPMPQQQQVPVSPLAQVQRHSNDGVPDWVDKAIVGVVLCLIVMLLRMMV